MTKIEGGEFESKVAMTAQEVSAWEAFSDDELLAKPAQELLDVLARLDISQGVTPELTDRIQKGFQARIEESAPEVAEGELAEREAREAAEKGRQQRLEDARARVAGFEAMLEKSTTRVQDPRRWREKIEEFLQEAREKLKQLEESEASED